MSTEPQCPGCRDRDEIILEFRTTVAKLQARVAELEQQVGELHARLNQNSSNSSCPPSTDPPQTPKRPSQEPTGRKPGGQPGHPGHARTRLPPDRVNPIVDDWPAVCGRCQAALPKAPQPDDPEPAWHQVAEIPLLPAIVTEHQAQGSRGSACGHCTWGDPSRLRARIPAEIRAHAFGANLAAIVVLMSALCRGAKRIIEEFVETVFQVPMSLGTIANLEPEASAAWSAPYQEAQEAIRAAPVKNTDETRWKQAGKKRRLWMAATQTVAYFKICIGRGKAELRELLGDAIQGVVGSDRLSVYNPVALSLRQVCWSHRKRDFQKWVDRGGEAGLKVGQAGLEAAQRLFALWRDFREKRIDRSTIQAALIPVQDQLRAALDAGEASDDAPVQRFCRNILAIDPAVWTFARIEGLEPTNNHAERTLRRAVIWRKVRGGAPMFL